MTIRTTIRLLFLILLAAALPLLPDRAAAEEIALKCTFSLWNDPVEVSGGRTGAINRPPKLVERREAIEARLARVPSQNFEITRVIDLQAPMSWRDSRSGRRLSPNEKNDDEWYFEEHHITPESILIRTAAIGPEHELYHELHPGRGLGLGFFHFLDIRVSRFDLSADVLLVIYFGKDGRPAYIGRLGDMDENNIRANVKNKGSCARVPKML